MDSISPTLATSVPGVLHATDPDRVDVLAAATREARQIGGAALVRACCAQADHYVATGQMRAASERMLEALVGMAKIDDPRLELTVERRDAWIASCLGEARAEARLEALRRTAHEQAHDDAPILDLYVAHNRARTGDTTRVTSLVDQALAELRSGDARLHRMALFAALVRQAIGQCDEAQVEALRVRSHAVRNGLKDLEALASLVLEQLRKSHSADDRVHHLVSVAIDVSRQRDLPELFHSVAASALALLGAERAFVIRSHTQGITIEAALARHGADAGSPSMSIVQRTLAHGAEIVSADIDHQFSAAASVVSLGLRTALCVPMLDGPDVLGAIYADSTTQTTEQLEESAWLVRAFAAHAVAAVRNVELYQRQSERERRNRELHHDVCNLVSTLQIGLSELEQDAQLEPWAAEVVRSLQTVTGLIDGEVSAALDGTREPIQLVDLGRLADRCLAFMRHEARLAQVELVGDTTRAMVLARSGDLQRVITNLLGNAVKYSPPNSRVHLTVTTASDTVSLIVQDQGPGVPLDQIERIFGSGNQAPGHLPGHGLGLGLCQRVVHEIGGDIRARNVTNGARFIVSLPADPSAW